MNERVKALLSDDHFSVDGTLIRGLGEHEELSPKGRQRRAGGAGPQRREGLSWREAQQ
jgi:hypothetical protein